MSMRIGLVLAMSFLGTAAPAEPSEQILTQSAAFAAEALSEIENGNRQRAIVMALKGLPEAPDAAAMAALPEARDALFRAVASRILRWDHEGFHYYAVNADGTRAIVAPANPTLVQPASADRRIETDPETGQMVVIGGEVYLPIEDEPPVRLVDPRTGEVIADLVAFADLRTEVYGPAAPGAFSPDGSEVAFWHTGRGEVARFAANDGSPLPPLTGLRTGQPGSVIGYAPDGTRVAAVRDDNLAVWDVTSGDMLENIALPRLVSSVVWAWDGSLVALQSDVMDPRLEYRLLRWTDGTWQPIVELSGRMEPPSQYMLASQWGPHILLDAETRTYVVHLDTDQVVDVGPNGHSFHRFVRDGQAVVVLRARGLLSFGKLSPIVTALDGTELEAGIRDRVVLDQYPVDLGGTEWGMGAVRPYTYRGTEVPLGPELHGFALALLSGAEVAEVAKERIDYP